MTLHLAEIERILNTPNGVFVAASMCRDGMIYRLPNDKFIPATTPSALIHELQTWYAPSNDPVRDHNPVRAFFAPQMVFTSTVEKQRLLLDLLDYAHELTKQIDKASTE